MKTQKITENHGFSAAWQELNHNQRRYVIARSKFSSKAETAKALGLSPDTVYGWPDLVDEAVDLLIDEITNVAVDILTNAVAEAAMVKVVGLDSSNERVRQDVASEILDRRLGTAVQKSEVGLSESTRQLLAPFFALAARCITDSDKMEEFKTEVAKIAAGDDA